MISSRLKVITEFIDKKDRIIDVGCDHGLLSIYLYQNSLCSFIIASDKNHKALQNAIKNIKQNNLANKISTFISDGINEIYTEKYKINTLIMAGMGTKTILKILDNPKSIQIKKLVIQSNKEHYELRKKIIQKGFYIADEKIILDNKKYYLTICFKKGCQKKSRFLYQWGIIKKENLEYYNHLLTKYKTIYSKIPYSKLLLKWHIKRLLKELNKIIKTYQK